MLSLKAKLSNFPVDLRFSFHRWSGALDCDKIKAGEGGQGEGNLGFMVENRLFDVKNDE